MCKLFCLFSVVCRRGYFASILSAWTSKNTCFQTFDYLWLLSLESTKVVILILLEVIGLFNFIIYLVDFIVFVRESDKSKYAELCEGLTGLAASSDETTEDPSADIPSSSTSPSPQQGNREIYKTTQTDLKIFENYCSVEVSILVFQADRRCYSFSACRVSLLFKVSPNMLDIYYKCFLSPKFIFSLLLL